MNKKERYIHFKAVFKAIVTVLSWTAFALVIIVGGFLLYYVISAQIYSSRGEKFEPPFALYTIISPSMEPKLKVYDVILNFREKDPDNINKGDIITFVSTSQISEGMTVTHRVIEKVEKDGVTHFRTKGDNNKTPDGGLTPMQNIQGKTFLKIPQLGRIQFFVASKGGWFFVVLVPALGVIIYDILKLFKLVGVKKKIDKVSNENEKTSEPKKDTKEEAIRKEEIKNRLRNKKEKSFFDSLLPKLKKEDSDKLVKEEQGTKDIDVSEQEEIAEIENVEETTSVEIESEEEKETKRIQEVKKEEKRIKKLNKKNNKKFKQLTKDDFNKLMEEEMRRIKVDFDEEITEEKESQLDEDDIFESTSNVDEVDESVDRIAKIITQVESKNNKDNINNKQDSGKSKNIKRK